MSDIVERLRKITLFDEQGRIAGFSSLLAISEAADEIERLRALQPEGKVEAVAKAEPEIRITEHNQYVIGQLHFNDPCAAIGWLAIYRPADVEKAKEVFAAALLPVGQTRKAKRKPLEEPMGWLPSPQGKE